MYLFIVGFHCYPHFFQIIGLQVWLEFAKIEEKNNDTGKATAIPAGLQFLGGWFIISKMFSEFASLC